MGTDWERELADFLNELITIQGHVLAYLREKRTCLANADAEGLAALIPRCEYIQSRLQQCLDRRSALLNKARQEGFSVDNVRTLAESAGVSRAVSGRLAEAAHNMRLLQIHNLTNWMLNQRALMHLSQLIEIVATGGQRAPTYEKRGAPACESVQGSLLDQSI
ncbi:flagellar export chaperone FlgN [Thermogutta sp.]|uniref:flagellar export chaperone FlgN n=1 Tax=Thermogutta sp. TaxID=1962930 RepID=UPI003C7E27EC